MKKRSLFAHLIPIYAAVFVGFLCVTHLGSRVVTVAAENAPIQNRRCIVIDAGHGGIDGGATSCTGVLESQLNLEIAVRLNDLFQFLGFHTRMIRTTDTSVYTEGNTIAAQKVSDLKQRVKIVNETENAILISIHQNTFSDSRYCGAQVFYAPDINSQRLAKNIQESFIQTLNPGSHRQSKPSDGIYLMQHIENPGILIECGFLSNPEEEARLRSADYQQKIACVIVSELAKNNANT